jgi:hypothetical protein
VNQYLMYQGIPFDGDTPQPMFWDVTPIKVVAQADYDAVVAELAAEKMAHSVTIAEEHESRTAFQDRIAQTEAALLRHGHKDGSCGLCASLESTPRVAHSKSEYKRLTAMGVECAPPETPNYNIPPWHLSKRVPGCRCDGCQSLLVGKMVVAGSVKETDPKHGQPLSTMDNFARGAIRATVISVEGNPLAAIRITAPTKVRNGVRVMDIHPKTAAHLAIWLIENASFIKGKEHG